MLEQAVKAAHAEWLESAKEKAEKAAKLYGVPEDKVLARMVEKKIDELESELPLEGFSTNGAGGIAQATGDSRKPPGSNRQKQVLEALNDLGGRASPKQVCLQMVANNHIERPEAGQETSRVWSILQGMEGRSLVKFVGSKPDTEVVLTEWGHQQADEVSVSTTERRDDERSDDA